MTCQRRMTFLMIIIIVLHCIVLLDINQPIKSIFSFLSAEIEGDDDDDWKKLFYYGGGMLLVSTGVTLSVLLLKQSNKILSKGTRTSVVPINIENENTRNYNSRRNILTTQTLHQQPRVSNTRFRGFQKNQKQMQNQSGGLQQQSFVPMPDQVIQKYQQPSVSMPNQHGGVQQYQQTSVPVTNQHGGVQHYQQPSMSLQNQPGGVQHYQQPSMLLQNQPGGVQHYQQQSVSVPNQQGGFHQLQQSSLPMQNQQGGFHQFQQSSLPMQNQQEGFHQLQQSSIPMQNQQGGFHQLQQSSLPMQNQQGGFHQLQKSSLPMQNQQGGVQQLQAGVSIANQNSGFKPYQIRHDVQLNVQGDRHQGHHVQQQNLPDITIYDL